MPGQKSLTPKQKKYCENRAKGMSKAGSYRAAYKPCKTKQIDAIRGFELEKKEKIANQIAYLNSLAEAGYVLNRSQIESKLTDFALDDTKPDGVQLKAIDQLSKVKGFYSDSNINVINTVDIGDKIAYIDSMLD